MRHAEREAGERIKSLLRKLLLTKAERERDEDGGAKRDGRSRWRCSRTQRWVTTLHSGDLSCLCSRPSTSPQSPEALGNTFHVSHSERDCLTRFIISEDVALALSLSLSVCFLSSGFHKSNTQLQLSLNESLKFSAELMFFKGDVTETERSN